jgi:hypothetical protein
VLQASHLMKPFSGKARVQLALRSGSYLPAIKNRLHIVKHLLADEGLMQSPDWRKGIVAG